ncbi:MAG: pyruvate kinase [Candidatus Sumerlaeaceae bacterium]
MAYTKIVATIGPATNTPEMIAALIAAGADVFRLNMSHGVQAGHAAVIRMIRAASRAAGQPIGILCDLSGPKIRIGTIAAGPVILRAGDRITITTEQVEGEASRVGVNYADLPEDVQPGQHILLDDGLLEWQVESVAAPEVHCVVVRGGPLSSHKGLNLPNTRLNISSLTEKDRADMEFGLENDVDMFAISFVKRAEDVKEARGFMQSLGGSLPLIAKIEKGEAVENIEQILHVADGAMVARGDLGVEIPLERVPHVQKRVIALCNRLGKPVITATQMLDSMIRSPRPTRAEVTDVANAILDGSDAVMLSGETATGAYPVATVEMMNRISEETEKDFNHEKRLRRRSSEDNINVPEAISHATAMVASELKVRAVLCLTQGGSTARRVARFRPRGGILAYCPLPRTAQQLCLTWGVCAVSRDSAVDIEAERRQGSEVQIRKAISVFKERGAIKPGDRLVVAAGLPLHEPGSTNLIRVVDVD